MGCVDICPTDCIVEHRPATGASDLPNQLFIDPADCIDCNNCVSECPWEAIFPDVDVPVELEPDIALNAIVRERRQEFHVPQTVRAPMPDADAVLQNKKRWGI
jgi:ferredoxin